MSAADISADVQAVITASVRAAARPTTLVEELLADQRYDRRNGIKSPALHLEARELVRFVAETCDDESGDMLSFLCDAANDAEGDARNKLNELTAKLLLGTITIDEQQRWNDLMRSAMIDSGAHKVRFAMEQAERSHTAARPFSFCDRETGIAFAGEI
jgi:hypothetical protein